MTSTAAITSSPVSVPMPSNSTLPRDLDITSIMLRLGKLFAHATLIERIYYKSTNFRITIDLFRDDNIRRKEGSRHSVSDLYLVAPDVVNAFGKSGCTPTTTFHELATALERFYNKLKSQPPVRTKVLRTSWNEIDPIADKLFGDLAILRAQGFEFKKGPVTVFVNSYNSTLNKHLRTYDQKMFSVDMETCATRVLKTLSEPERAVIYAVRNALPIPPNLDAAYQRLLDKYFVSPSSKGIVLLIPNPTQEVGKKSYAQYGGVVVEKVKVAVDLPSTASGGDVATFLDSTEMEEVTVEGTDTDPLLDLWAEFLTTLAQRGNITPTNNCVRIQSPVMRHAREYSMRRIMAYLDLVSVSAPMREKSKTVYTYTALPAFFRTSFTAKGLTDYVCAKDMSETMYAKFLAAVTKRIGDNTHPIRITNNDIADLMAHKEDSLGGYDMDNFRKIAMLRGDLDITRDGFYFNYAKPAMPSKVTPEPTPSRAPEVTWSDVVGVKASDMQETAPSVNPIPTDKVVSASGRFESQPTVVTEADLPYMKRGPKFVEPPAPALKPTTAQDGPLISPYGVRTEAVLSMVRLKMSLSGKPVPLTDLCKVFEADLTSDQMWRVLKTLDEKGQVILSYPNNIPLVHAHSMSDKGIEIKFMIPRDQVWVEYVES